MTPPRAILRSLFLLASCALLIALLAWAGMAARLFRAPYPGLGKSIAWALGSPEPAYNFGVVSPGALYRSGAPDARFVRYLRERYGIERIVSLAGPHPGHEAARQLGIDVAVFDWAGDRAPSAEALEAVLSLIDRDRPVLVHCHHGALRAGLAAAAWRVLRDDWSREQAMDELRRYRPDGSLVPRLGEALDGMLSGAGPRAGGERPPSAAGARRTG